MPGEEDLIEAVRALTSVVKQLEETLKSDYPKRAEIRRARTRFAWFTVFGLLCSSLMTIGVVSGCFLSKAAVDGHPPALCGVVPGYNDTQERSDRSRKRFVILFRTTDENSAKIERLERHILRPERQNHQ